MLKKRKTWNSANRPITTPSGGRASLGRDSYVPQVNCQHATAISIKRKTNEIKFGTRNVCTLFESGKLENLKLEIDHLELDIFGLSEVRWRGNGEIV